MGAARRVSPLTREKARKRMLALPQEEKERRLKAMAEGRARARGPEALAKIEKQMDALGYEFRTLDKGDPRRCEIIHELRPLGRRWASLRYQGE